MVGTSDHSATARVMHSCTAFCRSLQGRNSSSRNGLELPSSRSSSQRAGRGMESFMDSSAASDMANESADSVTGMAAMTDSSR